MRSVAISLAMAAMLTAGCHHRTGAGGSRDMTALGLFGGANIEVKEFLCAGRITLSQGSGAVKDGCFTGDTNIVLCTDATNANPVRCTPAPGELTVGGTGSDVISYVRIK